jgi:hypothetical protein
VLGIPPEYERVPMKIRHLSAAFAFGFAAYIACGRISAQGTTPAPDSSTTANRADTKETLKHFLERTFTVTGQVRLRLESTLGSDFSLTPGNEYLLSRIRLGLAFRPVSWLRVAAEAADARAMFYRAIPPSNISDPFDLRQAYVEVGKLEGNGVRILVGRQDFTLGSGRLIAVGDWGNDFRTYDVARAVVRTNFFKLDLAGGSPLLMDPTRFDRHKPGDHFYAAYGTFDKLIPNGSIEPYFFARTQVGVKDKQNIVGDADTLYSGLRLIGKLPGRFDYSAEGVRELGSYSHDAINAWGYVAGGGWTVMRSHWTPRLSSDFLYASGDSGKKDGFHQGFDCMYGLNQPLNSMTGQFSWHNIQDWRAGVDFLPSKKWKAKVDFRDYWLATTQDGLYNAPGTRTVFNTKATSNHVGEGVDALVNFFLNKKTTITTGVGVLRPGSYLTQSGKTSGFLYPSISILRLL